MARTIRHPTTYVIAGPNGAGKTTFATEFLPDFVNCREFLNADLIAAGLSPFAPETQNVRAGRLLLERIGELSRAREDFGFETTLSGRTHAKLLTELKSSGYRIDLFFLWLPSPDLAVLRVAERVSEGGHAVPEEVVRRRYASGPEFFSIVRPTAWFLAAVRLVLYAAFRDCRERAWSPDRGGRRAIRPNPADNRGLE